jgi:hypothetical protein
VDDLLDFATNLDFDQYLEDMEVQEALKFVQERVAKLKAADSADVNEEDREFGEAEPQMSVADRVAYHKKVLERMEKRRGRADDEVSNASHMSKASVMTTESQLLHEGGLKQVHSAASVRMLMKAASKMEQISEGVASYNLAVEAPVISTYDVRPKIKQDPSNLPYLKRHPAA